MPKKKNKKKLEKVKAVVNPVILRFQKAVDRIPVIDGLIFGALAYIGYKEMKGNPMGLLWGPIALKLATAGNPISGVAGLSALALMGLWYPHGPEVPRLDTTDPIVEKDPETGLVTDVICPEGWQRVYIFGVGWQCMKGPPGFFP